MNSVKQNTSNLVEQNFCHNDFPNYILALFISKLFELFKFKDFSCLTKKMREKRRRKGGRRMQNKFINY